LTLPASAGRQLHAGVDLTAEHARDHLRATERHVDDLGAGCLEQGDRGEVGVAAGA